MNKITWRGKTGNKTFQDLKIMIFNQNFTSFETEMVEHKEEFFITHGFCKKLILNGSRRAYIGTTEESTLYIVDSKKVNPLLILNVLNGQAHFGNHFENKFDYRSLVLKFSIHDKSIYEGISCINYDKIEDYSYGQCIENVLRTRLLQLYECLPPWFLNSVPDDICEYQNQNTPKTPEEQELKELDEEFRSILMGVIDMQLLKDWLKYVSLNKIKNQIKCGF